ncbi:MAG: hypothetical protein IR153_07860 [Flavobacterium sp.]|nr:hypothetical protein [Flavobacterium sp.]
MSDDKKKSQVSDHQAGNINPDDVNFKHPAKKIPETEKVDIMESEIGRETSQTPASESDDNQTSQIDEGTKDIQKEKKSDE